MLVWYRHVDEASSFENNNFFYLYVLHEKITAQGRTITVIVS